VIFRQRPSLRAIFPPAGKPIPKLYAWVAGQVAHSFVVMSLEDLANPTIVGVLTSTELYYIYDTEPLDPKTSVATERAYNALHTIDVKVKTSPALIAKVSTAELDDPREVVVEDSLAYTVAFDEYALVIVDCTDPTAPTILSSVIDVTLDGAAGVRVLENYAYVGAYYADALTIVDISDPATPAIVGSISTPQLNTALYLDVVGNYTYVPAHLEEALTIVDVSNPTAPVQMGYIYRWFAPCMARVRENYCFISGSVEGGRFDVIDVSDKTSPTAVGALYDALLEEAYGFCLVIA